MQQLFLLKDNRRLSDRELLTARSICDEAVELVKDRPDYIRRHNIDPRFALPDANWSYDAPNEFVQLFRRVAEGDRQTLSHLRGLAPVFSGYHLYQVQRSEGLIAADIDFNSNLDHLIAERLRERNETHVNEWQQLTYKIPRRFIFSPPPMMGEIGHELDGVIVNNDTCTYQERVNLILGSGLSDWLDRRIEATGELKICEIGGGYGALAHWFKQAYPEASYTIIDLPESLLFSRLYLSLTRPDLRTSVGFSQAPRGFRFMPNYLAEGLTEPFDLVINTLSMSEMSDFQIRRYVELLKQHWLVEGGLFFEQNQDNRPLGLQCAEDIFANEFSRRLSLKTDGQGYRNGSPNVWSMSPFHLESRPCPVGCCGPVELIEDLGEFNLVRSSVFWGLRKDLGPTDPLTLEFKDEPPCIFAGTSAEAIKEKVCAFRPHRLRANGSIPTRNTKPRELLRAERTYAMSAISAMEFVVNHPKPKAKVSVILLDWGVRESYHSLQYLNWQSVDREQYELIWIEFYERKPKALHEAVEEAENAGKPLIDKLIVMNHPRNFIFHKHRMYNLGVVVAEGEICVICDSDAMFKPNFIQRIITAFEDDPHGVIHLDEVRSIDRSFYPFNFPTFEQFLASQCQNWTGRTTKGLDNSRDMLHEANYGACLAARREDIINIGGSDEHLDYLGYICGPYDLTFRLVNAGGTERWLTDEYLYHTWHPGESGINIDYHGPSDGRGMASRALDDRASGNVFPGLENGAIRALRDKAAISRAEALQSLAAPSDAEWRDVARLGEAVAPPKLIQKAARRAFDIYLYGGSWYAIPTQNEIFDPVKAKAGIYAPCYRSDSRRDLDRTIRLAAWIQSTPHFVKVAYRRMLPVVKRLRSLLGFGSNRPFDPDGHTEQLVREGYRRHNIVHFRGIFFGISQSLGAFKPALAQSIAECPYINGSSVADVMYQIRCDVGLPRIMTDAVLGSFPVAIAAMTVRGSIQLAARIVASIKREPLLTPSEALERFPSITTDQMTELIESYESVLTSQH